MDNWISSCNLSFFTWPVNQEIQFGARNSNFIRKASRPRRWWISVPSRLTQVRIQAFFYAKRLEGMVGCCKLLGISFVLADVGVGSGHSVSVNLQQDKYYSLFCNFLFPCEWKCVTPFKGQSLGNGLSCTFQATDDILNWKQKQWRTKIKGKETDLIQSGFFFPVSVPKFPSPSPR